MASQDSAPSVSIVGPTPLPCIALTMTRRIAPTTGFAVLLAAVASFAPALSEIALAQPAGANPYYHRPVRQAPHRSVHHHHRTVVVAPVRAVPAVRPWYWGRVVAGVTIGTIITVAAINSLPKAPSPELCWFWSDASKTRGYWNYCVAPKQP